MILEKLKIKNFGTFDRKTSIDLKGSFTTIIGDNGTGKSTILFAIKILLDWQTRRKGISEEWIPNLNEPTLMEFVFDASSFSKLNVFLPIEENRKIRIKLEFKFETEFNLYFPIVYIGIIEELKYLHSQKLPFDNFIQLVHINARSESKIHEWIEEKYKNSGLLDVIQLKINKANQEISGVDEIKSFNDEVNQQINHIFQEEKFKVSLQSNVQTTKIGKALNFFPTYNQKNIVSHGEGFEKIIAIMSNLQNTNDNNKIRIILLDEMENNLFYIYQSKAKRYLSMLLEYSNVSQIIVTTHSPNIVQISPDSAITKLRTNAKPAHFLFGPSWNFDYYQKNLAIAIFYEFVLVVEGHSEKMFFEYIFKKNQFMKDKIDVSKNFYPQ